MKRLLAGLGTLAIGGALALALAVPASAAPAVKSGSAANSAATRPVPAGAVKVGSAAATTPRSARTAGGIGTGVASNHLDGACDMLSNGDGDFCLWFFSNFVGSYADFFFSDFNLFDNVFLTPGAGQGAVVGADAESDLNADANLTAVVCTGTGQTGTCGVVPPRTFGNFVAPWRNGVASFQFV